MGASLLALAKCIYYEVTKKNWKVKVILGVAVRSFENSMRSS